MSDNVKKMISPQRLVEVDCWCMGGRSAKLGNRRSGAGGKVALDLTPAMRTKVQALCADDNATFARRHGLPLDRYGYLLPGYDTSTHSASESSQTVLSQR